MHSRSRAALQRLFGISRLFRNRGGGGRTAMSHDGGAAGGDEPAADYNRADLKKRLSPIQYHVTQEKGTERAFTGKYNKTTEAGLYTCVVCNETLFTSETKFDSGCGWPAFNDVIDQKKVKLTTDTSNGMIRTEVQCGKCDAHLGHVFKDGPPPTGRRFCINSASMNFHPANPEK